MNNTFPEFILDLFFFSSTEHVHLIQAMLDPILKKTPIILLITASCDLIVLVSI